ncbi:hypothetical protein KC19_1G284600 [Ceratodon purpureus]|uniref:Uncharacterized protein n=1 Tax=Ceratodon purpureus TaxID=3225 RepID=A0A8T0JDF1_CERPU|nr:hypothetical protein KC19_1G284600 [Ceratodon purpureus]
MLHLRSYIKLKHLHRNPLATWEDAQWMYEWSKPNLGTGLCTWLVFILFSEETFSMRNPGAYRWLALPQSIQQKLPALNIKLANWRLTINELKFFLGPSPPTNLPEVGTQPWRPEDPPERAASASGGSDGDGSPIKEPHVC